MKSIQIFGFEITFFGLVIALGMLLGMGFVILEAKRCGENKDDYLEMMIMSLLLGVVGSRMLYVLCSWNLYKGNIIEIFNVRNGGLTFYGGLFGGMLGAAIYCGVRRKSFMQMADTASMGIVIAQIIGRWGDFFNRESGDIPTAYLQCSSFICCARSSEVTSAMSLETIGWNFLYSSTSAFLIRESLVSAFVSPDACVEAQKLFPRRSISEISGRIWSRTILHRTSSNRQAYDSGNFCWNFPADLSSTVCNLCYDRSCGRNHGEKEGGKAQTQERTGL